MRQDSEELGILTDLSSFAMRSEMGNCVVPIQDSFEDPEDPLYVFIVTELLHDADSPHFTYVEEALEFFEQVIQVCSEEFRVARRLSCSGHPQALVYFHSHGISNVYAYSLCSHLTYRADFTLSIRFHVGNLVMRTTNMFPRGFHPVLQHRLPSDSGDAPSRTRGKCAVQYMFKNLRMAVRDKRQDEHLGPAYDMMSLASKIREFSDTVSSVPLIADLYS